jgi:rubrerythrin
MPTTPIGSAPLVTRDPGRVEPRRVDEARAGVGWLVAQPGDSRVDVRPPASPVEAVSVCEVCGLVSRRRPAVCPACGAGHG